MAETNDEPLPMPPEQSSKRIVVSAPLFQPSAELLAALKERRLVCGVDEITTAYAAFLLDPDLGPATYLTSDGRIVWDDDEMWGVVGNRGEVFAAVVAGAQKTGIVALLSLLPQRTPSAIDCERCSATGRFDFNGQLQDVHGKAFSVVCMTCAGLGWTDPALALTDSVLETPIA